MIKENDTTCPVTGLPIERRPEWTDINFDTDFFRITFFLIGSNIIMAQTTGNGNYDTTLKSLELRDKIVEEVIPKNEKFIYVENYTDLKKISLDTNSIYIKMSRSQKRLKAIIFFGASILLKTLIKIGKKTFPLDFYVEISESYSEAISLAMEIENNNYSKKKKQNQVEEKNIAKNNSNNLESSSQFINNLPIIQKPHWVEKKLTKDYAVTFSLISKNIIIISPIGDCKTDGMALLLEEYKNFLKEVDLENHKRVNIWDYSKIIGYPPKIARNQFIKFMTGENKQGFLSGYIAMNLPSVMKILVNVGKKLYKSNYPILFANDFESAVKTSIELLADNEKLIDTQKEPAHENYKKLYTYDDMVNFSDDMMKFLGMLSWDDMETYDENFLIDDDHPFKSVFEAISIIKWDFDSTINEKNRMLEEVEEANRKINEVTDQLIQTEKLSVMGELSAGITHELKQPINTISIISQSMLRNIKKDNFNKDNLIKDISEIYNLTKKMSEMIENMTYLFRKSHDIPKEVIEINQLLNNIVSLVDKQLAYHKIKLRTEFSNLEERIKCNIIQIEQVILNIINNARDVLNSSNTEEKVIIIKSLSGTNNNIIFEISDNGPGMSQETLDKIFDSFFTTKEAGKGTGLGLSVSNRIIKDHKGKIEVSSNPGNGTSFRIILPKYS